METSAKTIQVGPAPQRYSNTTSLLQDRIYTTREYRIFKNIKGNRPVNKSHVRTLLADIKKNGLRKPIEVNSKLQLIDGQHRLEACKLANVAVKFVCIGEASLADVQYLNTSSKSWGINDFTESFIIRGNENYRTFKQFQDKYQLPHTMAYQLLMFGPGRKSAGSKPGDVFRKGNFVVNHFKEATEFAEQLLIFRGIFSGWKSTYFMKALQQLIGSPKFKFQRFIDKAKVHRARMHHCGSTEQYVAMIEDIYNYRVPESEKVGLRYAK